MTQETKKKSGKKKKEPHKGYGGKPGAKNGDHLVKGKTYRNGTKSCEHRAKVLLAPGKDRAACSTGKKCKGNSRHPRGCTV